MNWGLEDLAAAVVLVLTAVAATIVVFKTSHSPLWRALLAGGVILVVLAVWAQLAVGIF